MTTTLIPAFDYQKAIQGLLDSKAVTQAQIGDAIGVSQGRVSQVLNGVDSSTFKYEVRHKLFELCAKHRVGIYYLEEC